MVGAGATGGFYGGMLFKAGRDVTFLLREGRARQIRQAGLQIVTHTGEHISLHPPIVTAEELRQPHTPFDLINSTLDKPCRRTHEFLTCSELYYNVTETEPVWFFVCPPRGALCYCNRDTHFALNPGGLWQPFRESVKHSNWVITRPAINHTTSTTSASMATVTLTTTVWP